VIAKFYGCPSVKVKVKCNLVQALRLCTGLRVRRGRRGIVLLFLDHGTRKGEGSASRLGHSLPPRKIRYPLYRRLAGPQGTRRGEGSASRLGHSLPPRKTRYPLYRRLAGPQGRSGQVRKNLASTAIRTTDRPARSQSLY